MEITESYNHSFVSYIIEINFKMNTVSIIRLRKQNQIINKTFPLNQTNDFVVFPIFIIFQIKMNKFLMIS